MFVSFKSYVRPVIETPNLVLGDFNIAAEEYVYSTNPQWLTCTVTTSNTTNTSTYTGGEVK